MQHRGTYAWMYQGRSAVSAMAEKLHPRRGLTEEDLHKRKGSEEVHSKLRSERGEGASLAKGSRRTVEAEERAAQGRGDRKGPEQGAQGRAAG